MKRLTLFAALLLLLFCGCEKETGKSTYYAPTEVVLNAPEINTSSLAATISAMYNGDDSGIAESEFKVVDTGSGSEIPVSDFSFAEGKASAKLTGLSVGHDYTYNFIITTKGGNTVKAGEDGRLPFSMPSEFTYSTITTKTAKVLQLNFNGAPSFISGAEVVLVDGDGVALSNLPHVDVQDGFIRAMFKLDEWVQDIYLAHFKLSLYDGTNVETPEVIFPLIPLVEHATVSAPATTEAGDWTFSAEYDGEDKTISEAYFEVFNDNGELIGTIPAECKGGKASGKSSGNTYGKFSVKFTVKLVEGSVVTDGPLMFSVAKPRAYDSVIVDNITFYNVNGGPTSASSTPTTYACSGYEWEFVNVFIKPTKEPPYFIVDKSKEGYFANVTAFPLGIKRLIINLTNSKEIKNFEMYARAKTSDDWTTVSGVRETVSGDSNIAYRFVYDMPLGDLQFFKFLSTANTSEIRMYSFQVDYFTEPEATE